MYKYHIVVLCQAKNEICVKKMRAVQIVHNPMGLDIWVKEETTWVWYVCPFNNHSGIHLREIYITGPQLPWFSNVELGPSIFLFLESRETLSENKRASPQY